ncbi:MAG: cytochrome c biogenesis protein CcdA [Patescibacteria group bacterium]
MKKILLGSIIGLAILTIFGLVWGFTGGSAQAGSLVSGSWGWYLFSYAMGLTMIVLPCTLPLAFVIVPMVMKKGAAKGFSMALAFGLGVAITLSVYGIIFALVGKATIGTINAPLETVKNWVYFAAGIFAYLFALGEIGLIKFRLPSYTGAAPAFIQHQQDYLKAFLLGLFLGNIGVGCPHPATPLILIEIASSQSVFYGWSLFLTHAIGRIIPLLILAFLAILGVNALSWLVARKDKLERATGWAMVFVAGFILTLGLFTHDWWVASGQHTFLESLTQEEHFTTLLAQNLGTANVHRHGPEEVVGDTGLFGLPLWLGNWFLVALWIVPMVWMWRRVKRSSNTLSPWCGRFVFTLSLLFILTFVYTLPYRFLTASMADHHDEDESSVVMPPTDHGTMPEVQFSTIPLQVAAQRPTVLNFSLRDNNDQAVAVSELDLGHGKPMHIIGVREDLQNFFHLHPRASHILGLLSVPWQFPSAGTYHLWSEIEHGGEQQSVAHDPVEVIGSSPTLDKKISFERNQKTRGYNVSLEISPTLFAARQQELSLQVTNSSGQLVELADYIGAQMHLTIISENLKQFIHAHPSEGDHSVGEHGHDDGHDHEHVWQTFLTPALAQTTTEPSALASALAFDVTFPEPGRYKLFAQFRPAGAGLATEQALLSTFWVEVAASGNFGDLIFSKPSLAIISLILMFGLSRLVKKFI